MLAVLASVYKDKPCRGACAVGFFGSVCVARGFSARGLKADRVWLGADEGFAEVCSVPGLARTGAKTAL